MAFNKAPSSWLTGYTYTSDQISFSLSGDYTAASQDAISLIFRVTDEILQRYTAKVAGDRPIQWESTATIAQATSASPNSLKTITNKFVLDAELFYGLAIPSLQVTITAPDMVYTGYSYGAASYVAPTGSVVTLTYSADGGQTFTDTAPTARGSYIARIVATKDGRSGTARAGFVILKSTPTLTVSSDIIMEYSAGTMITSFYSAALFTSVISTNPAVVSVVSFTTGGAVVLQRNGVGQADITASTAETSEYYPTQASQSVILTLLEATITTPATLPISVGNGLSQNFTFTTNFTLTGTRYALMTFSSSNTNVATISKGSAYPPTINIVTGGACTITALFPGDSAYEEAASTTALTITGLTPVQAVTIAKGPSQALFSGDDGIMAIQPASPQVTGAVATTIQIGLDSDNNGVADGQIPTFPYVFTITIANSAGTQGTTGALSTTFTNYVANNWISFSTSGDVITATISSLPTTINNGEVFGCALSATKAAASGVLAWTGQFDINVYKDGPRYVVTQSGMYGTMGNTLDTILGTSVTLNANSEFAADWNADLSHAAKIRIVPTGGASATGITASFNNNTSDIEAITFSDGSISKAVTANTDYNISIAKGGPVTLTVTTGLASLARTINFDIKKVVPQMQMTAIPGTGQPCCDASCGDVGMLVGPFTAQVKLATTPQNIAWSSPTMTRVTSSIVNAGTATTIGNPLLLNNGESLYTLGSVNYGDTSISFNFAGTDTMQATTIQKQISVRRGELAVGLTRQELGIFSINTHPTNGGGLYTINNQALIEEIRITQKGIGCDNQEYGITGGGAGGAWAIPLIIIPLTNYPFVVVNKPLDGERKVIGFSGGSVGACVNWTGRNLSNISIVPGELLGAVVGGGGVLYGGSYTVSGDPNSHSININVALSNGNNIYEVGFDAGQTTSIAIGSLIRHLNRYEGGLTGAANGGTGSEGSYQGFLDTVMSQNSQGTLISGPYQAFSNFVRVVRGVRPDSYTIQSIGNFMNQYNYSNGSLPALDTGITNFSFAVYTCPTLPYKDGYVGEYYDMPGSPVTLTHATDFAYTGEAEGGDNLQEAIDWGTFFSQTPTIQGYKIGQYTAPSTP